jgi:TolA-binding protein
MRTKVRITKQQIKEDKFTTFMLKSKEWLMINWQIVAIAAAVVVLAIVGIVYITGMKSGKQQEAGSRLTAAFAELKRGNNQIAILELGSIAEEYSGHIAAQAQFYLANAQYVSRNYDEAIADFQKYIDKYHDDPITTSSAIAGIAYCMENKQEFIAAGDKFLEAIQYYPESPSAPDYYVGSIRSLMMAEEMSRAEQILEELKEKYPNSDYLRRATMMVMRVNAE